jgi:hypothetical protein
MARKHPAPQSRDPAEGLQKTAPESPGSEVKARRRKVGKKDCEQKVDDAVEMTFPASDPTAPGSATGTEPAARPVSRKAPVISKEDIERAARGRG